MIMSFVLMNNESNNTAYTSSLYKARVGVSR